MLKILLFISLSFFYSTAVADDQTTPTQTLTTSPTTTSQTPVTTTDAPKPIPHYTMTIESPKPEETFQNSAQSITLSVVVTPELQPEDTVIAYVDGSAVGDPVHSTSIALPWLERGDHTLQAKIIQPKGAGAESETITIYQQRTSKLLP